MLTLATSSGANGLKEDAASYQHSFDEAVIIRVSGSTTSLSSPSQAGKWLHQWAQAAWALWRALPQSQWEGSPDRGQRPQEAPVWSTAARGVNMA